jgi:uncharacterized protein (DUF362 family)
MTKSSEQITFDPRVAVARTREPSYAEEPLAAEQEMRSALMRAARMLGWAEGDDEGAFGGVIPRGARVLIKPNLVMHANRGPWGMEPLVTHQSLIRAAVEEALLSGASEVTVGDAPIQGCDFAELMRRINLDAWAEELKAREPRFKGIRDFRRTVSNFVGGVRMSRAEGVLPEDRFVLFDLGGESLLEPITDGETFRVTCYDPRLLARTHAPGKHQYLVAREVIDADVVINLPKLKTHQKAGVTCALKNLIGINGNKEYLPHHRIGGSDKGGDCYPGGNMLRGALERLADRQNKAETGAGAKLWHGLSVPVDRALRMLGEDADIEGSWSGNDTIWRTCLDLNRILLYGRTDGTLAGQAQRRVLHIADAVVAGHGDGPLAPQPLPLGLLFAGSNAAAIDWVGALLLGYDPLKITVAREAFGSFRWPLTNFARGDVALSGDLGAGRADELLVPQSAPSMKYPMGWRDAVAAPSGDDAGASTP